MCRAATSGCLTPPWLDSAPQQTTPETLKPFLIFLLFLQPSSTGKFLKELYSARFLLYLSPSEIFHLSLLLNYQFNFPDSLAIPFGFFGEGIFSGLRSVLVGVAWGWHMYEYGANVLSP